MKNKEILITGGTGSLGKALTKALIPLKPKGIRIFSRSELNQYNMKREFKDSEVPISYIIGDIRDRDRLTMACRGVDYLINTAAMKRIEVCDSDPLECLKTNVDGVQNIVSAALDCGVEKVLQVSTDKAVYPTTLYGASKKCAEGLIINANVYSGDNSTKFMCVRYGNVLGSNGSVLGIFLKLIKENKPLTVTNPDMTRFWITLPNVCQFIVGTLTDYNSGIHIPKMTSSTMRALIESLQIIHFKKLPCKRIPTQNNEKLHEALTTIEEACRIELKEDRYVVNNHETTKNQAPRSWIYSSEFAVDCMEHESLTEMIKGVIDENL